MPVRAVKPPLRGALLLCTLMLFTSLSAIPLASAADQDGDGVDDSVDDCPYAKGNSTVDRQGCPDTDGDGTSDWNDRVTMSVVGWAQNGSSWAGSDNLMDAEFSPDGSQVVLAIDTGWVRIHNTQTQTNVLSRRLSTDSPVVSLDWSRDGSMIAATTGGGDDELYVMHANNLTNIWQYDVNTGGNDEAGDVEFNYNGTLVAYAMGRADYGNSVTGMVRVLEVSTGNVLKTLDPSSTEDSYDSVAWSPDGRRIAFGGRGRVFIHSVLGSWTSVTTLTLHSSGSQPRVNSIDWSPDGNWIATCDQYANSGQGRSVHVFNSTNYLQKWTDYGTTTCLSVEFSPDSRLLGVGWNYYSSYGNDLRVHNTESGSHVETLAGPCSGGCGTVNGFAWHPDGEMIVSAHGRENERAIWWKMNSDIDGDGYLNNVDEFPEDGTQWDDTDGDGYGDNPPPAYRGDECPNTWGNSTQDRYGCPDRDGDGWSDLNDDFPDDKLQWADADGDTFPDNTADTRDPSPYGAVDYLPNNPTQWNDSDGDGFGDNFVNSSWLGFRPTAWPGILISGMTPVQQLDIDVFPLDPDQWNDTDGDWVGDEPFTTRSDGCVFIWGTSIWDRLGCIDSDGDGWSDPDANWAACEDGSGSGDWKPLDPTQWCDSDGDGYGDNSTGTEGDACAGFAGTSYEDRLGCRDSDGDGWSDAGDPFPQDSSQWSDRDGDQCGDNPEGNSPDLFPDDSTQCGDRDGDGYGDFPSGPNGDWFPDDATQWFDTDRDGYGDNYADADWVLTRNESWPGIHVPGATDPDLCPLDHGEMDSPENRGCPDSDQDGVADNIDAFPDDPFSTSDRDGDGFPDDALSTIRDDCPDTPGNSTEGKQFGCPDSDGDGWADTMDDFANISSQWKDSDGDGYGDNWDNATWNGSRSSDWPGVFLEVALLPDAFPLDDSQWNDTDGDGFGDEANGTNPDAFPFIKSQWKDSDGDGFGDNTTRDAYEPDDCRAKYGTSWRDRNGCEDSDGDGTSDLGDACMWDPDVWEAPAVCAVTEPPDTETESVEGKDVAGIVMTIIGGLVLVLLLSIMVAMVARQAARRRGATLKATLDAHEALFEEEDKRREQWIQHYLSSGETEKARELGWVEKAEWQLHQEAEEAAEVEKIETLPEVLDLDDLLDDISD